MCGLVPKDGSRTDAIDCARSSIASKVPFVVAFQEYGRDLDIWSALVGDRDGELQFLLLDSSPSGQPSVRAEYFASLVSRRSAGSGVTAPVPSDRSLPSTRCRASEAVCDRDSRPLHSPHRSALRYLRSYYGLG